jgi:SPP1 family predicted phage head-tail adaptor
VKIGRRNRRVLAEEPHRAPDGEGGEVVTWMPRGMPKWACIEPLTGRELMRANQVIADMDARITLAWSPEAARILPTWRFRDLDSGATYGIVRPPINKSMSNEEIEFIVNSGANAG